MIQRLSGPGRLREVGVGKHIQGLLIKLSKCRSTNQMLLVGIKGRKREKRKDMKGKKARRGRKNKGRDFPSFFIFC